MHASLQIVDLVFLFFHGIICVTHYMDTRLHDFDFDFEEEIKNCKSNFNFNFKCKCNYKLIICCGRIMRISKFAVFLLVFGVIISLILAVVYSLIAIETTSGQNPGPRHKPGLQVDDKFQHLFWFLQISDLHISIFHDLSRISDFRQFCSVTIPKFNPKLVIASGDLTDAKAKDNIGSRQFEDEWKLYKSALDECQIPKSVTWLDIRGNHDNFNVADKNSEQNYYRNYSIQGAKYERSYLFTGDFNGDIYSFIGIDACTDPGPKRPFNFVGILTKNETNRLSELIMEAKRRRSDYIVWFGHYPTSCMLVNQEGGLRKMFEEHSEGYVYLCGHYHKFGGLIPKMYTLQKSGFFELELADWKDNREFRLLAFDHGLMSFIDVKHNDWPVVLITNPKDASFLNLKRDPVDLIRTSSHIRVLAFSLHNITKVSVRVDNQESWLPCKHVQGPLYVHVWNPKFYEEGLHIIEAAVEDSSGLRKVIKQSFSLTDPDYHFGFLARMVLMLDISVIFQLMFYTSLFVCIVPLFLVRYMHHKCKAGKGTPPIFTSSALKKLYFKFWLLSTIDRLYYPLMLYLVYICIGPWSIGELIDDHIGIIFLWGIYVNGTFLPGTFTFAYGFLQLVTLQVPLVILLTLQLSQRYQSIYNPESTSRNKCIFLDIMFVILLMFHTISAYFFWLSYGTMAFILGPLRTWAIIFSIVLYYQSKYLPKTCFRYYFLMKSFFKYFIWFQKAFSNI